MRNIAARTAFLSMQISALFFLGGCLESSSSSGSAPADPNPPGDSNSAPTISGVPSSSVRMGDAYSFTPSANDADDDPLTFSIQGKPNWLSFDTGDGALSGTPSLGDIGTYSGIEISVSDGNLSDSLPMFGVEVVQNADGSITLSWTAPTQNEDGSPLDDLAAYKFYYGTSSGNYSNEIRVDSPGITTYVLENLSPATYYLVATAINSSGVESRFSNEATKQIL